MLTWNFSRFDDDFVSADGDRQTVFLDQIRADVSQAEPDALAEVEHGTVIVIRNLKGRWRKPAITRLCRDVLALTDPISRITGREPPSPLEIVVYFNGHRQVVVEEQGAERLRGLIEEKAVLNLRGRFDSSCNAFTIDSKSTLVDKRVSLDDRKNHWSFGSGGNGAAKLNSTHPISWRYPGSTCGWMTSSVAISLFISSSLTSLTALMVVTPLSPSRQEAPSRTSHLPLPGWRPGVSVR